MKDRIILLFQSTSIIILIGILQSCNSDTSQIKEIVTYYPNKSIAEKYYVKSDSIKEGQFISYYKNGSIKGKCFFKNDKLDSIYKVYYEDGKLEDSLNYSKGYLFGEQFYFYSNSTLRKYAVVDGFDDVIYVLIYDSLGNEIKREGMAISPNIYCDVCNNHGKVNVGKTVLLNLMCSTPPDTEIEIYYGEILNPLGNLKKEKLSIKQNNAIAQEIAFTKKGVCKFYFIGVLKNKNGQIIARDSIFKELEVI